MKLTLAPKPTQVQQLAVKDAASVDPQVALKLKELDLALKKQEHET